MAAQAPPSQEHAGLFSRAVDWVLSRGWCVTEPARLSKGELDLLAADLGLTQADLLDVLPRGPDNRLLMDRMMRARGLDPEAVRRSGAAPMRDLELTCTRCASSGRCSRDLEAGTAAEKAAIYCDNTEVFDELLARGKG
jgi:Family of unknown function (DUF6455)